MNRKQVSKTRKKKYVIDWEAVKAELADLDRILSTKLVEHPSCPYYQYTLFLKARGLSDAEIIAETGYYVGGAE